MLNFPRVFFVCSLLVLWLAGRIGLYARARYPLKDDQRSDFAVVQGATLTLLGLLIGFTFSMAISRYDQREAYEEGEANAIGTEYLRADLMPEVSASIKDDLKRYTDLRIVFYQTRSKEDLRRINAETTTLQTKLWSTVSKQGLLQPTPPASLALSGMNDVLNSQGYTQASWWDRIPVSAWSLLVLIAIFANILVGYSIRAERAENGLLFVLPLIASISFFLIADIDSPRGGLIRVTPTNLISLSESLTR
jgi:hypothetical protein